MHFLLILFSILVLIEKKGASATLGVLEVHNFRGGFHLVLHLDFTILGVDLDSWT